MNSENEFKEDFKILSDKLKDIENLIQEFEKVSDRFHKIALKAEAKYDKAEKVIFVLLVVVIGLVWTSFFLFIN